MGLGQIVMNDLREYENKAIESMRSAGRTNAVGPGQGKKWNDLG